jgi:exonuclease SbcC
MIPLRVRLKGFLCYKEEQDISFDGASLWMLAGLNGSGKSAVFDAVTYALFGYHRGGKQDAHELINKSSDGLLAEFDFLLDGQAFRVRRTLQRKAGGGASGTQQVLRRRSANGNGQAGWDPVEGTSRRAEFDAWIAGNIGLNYETFTSSVLLLQNRAEKLLDSTAKGRFEVLAGIVDLERYERLHRLAHERWKEAELAVKGLSDRLNVLPEVGALVLVEAEGAIAAAEEARRRSQEQVEQMQALEGQAQRWAEWQTRLAEITQRCQEAQRVLAEAAVIERDLARLAELRQALPLVQTAVEQRGQIQESERVSAEIAARKQKQDEQQVQKNAALDQARQKRLALEARIAEDERRHRQVSAAFHKSAALLERLREHERQEQELARVAAEQAAFPPNLQAALREARKEKERLEALTAAVPLLLRFGQQRQQLAEAMAAAQQALAAQQTVEAHGKEAAAAVERCKPEVALAESTRRQADEATTQARTLLEEARRQLRELAQMRGAKVCRHCGQALTQAHLTEEKVRREKLAAEAETRFQQAGAAQKAALTAETQGRARLTKLEQELSATREQFVEQRQQADQARRDVERLQRECGQVYALVAEPFRARIAADLPSSWLDTNFPTAGDLEGLQREASGLPAVTRRFAQIEQLFQQWSQGQIQAETIRLNLQRLRGELPGDPEALRREHARLESEEQMLDRGLVAARTELAETQKEQERLSREREKGQQQLLALQGQLNVEEARRQQCRQALARAFKEMPAGWRQPAERAGLADLHGWARERDTLDEQKLEERGRQLEQARLGGEVLRRETDRLEAQIAGLPGEARQEPARVQLLLQQARQHHRCRDDELSQARQRHAALQAQHEQREQLEQQRLEADRHRGYLESLAKLLGRDRLQLHLVRQAERQVVDHANAVLDRISGGELYLRLAGEAGGEGNSEKALDLEAHHRTTGEKPINVAFLSGSQKFRVAVSLALGIGQYASRRHRPLESVIIDEGFGCLDRNGRQVMIQELQNLRSHMRCILLVSHQEEFADAFADGYHFAVQGGTTIATRFRR